MTNLVSAQDLATYLGQDVDTARANMLLADAEALSLLIVNPIPAAGTAIIKSAAARAYLNPSGVTAETVGPVSYNRLPGGVWLSKDERRALMAMAGRGGAFTVDPTPADAGEGLQPWGQNVTWLDGVPIAEDLDRL
jgi:hypothetical protein